MTARVTHIALDGNQHEIESDLDLSQPFTSVANLDLDGRRYELTAGPLTLGAEIVTALGLDGFHEELSYADGTLRIAHGTVTDPRTGVADAITVAAWHGDRHCLVASLYNVTTAEVLGILGAVRIAEHDQGITVSPGTAAVALSAALVLKEVPGVGLLEISGRTREAVRELPDWAGLALPGGELFRDTLSNGRPYFVLAAPAAVVTILPLAAAHPAGGGDVSVPALLGSLRVAVRRGQRW